MRHIPSSDDPTINARLSATESNLSDRMIRRNNFVKALGVGVISSYCCRGGTMADDEEKTLSLRVAKAIPSDVGHGRARVPFDNDLGLKPGDIKQ